jgi:hypothetical protein
VGGSEQRQIKSVVRLGTEGEVRRIMMTYYRGLFAGSYMVHRDVVGVAHGEESVDCAVLVATHRVDNRVPIRRRTG